MSSETLILCMTAVSIGALHTILGPDHYLPFVAMSRADGWSGRKTLGVTIACGLGHVAGSVAIGGCGLLLGMAVMQLEWVESLRGDLAAWLLIGFGLASVAWGLKQGGGDAHAADAGVAASRAVSAWTPWLAFLVFIFGPCEPLIPLLMVPAARADAGAVAAVVAAFAVATVGTMAIAVMAMRYGLSCLPLPSLGRFSHALAGLAILVCGVLVKVGL